MKRGWFTFYVVGLGLNREHQEKGWNNALVLHPGHNGAVQEQCD
jgi:hypothetical protein